MSIDQAKSIPAVAFNVPNQLTALRLLVAVVMFVLLPLGYYAASLVLFVIAAATDWLDGWYARRYGQVTTLGRILDPFADKVIVCGTFIYLLAAPGMAAVPWGLRAWMVVVIVGRELLVTALRGFLEERGADFSAKMSGKLKMGFQCAAAIAALCLLSYPQAVPAWVEGVFVVALWIALLLTIYSGLIYVTRALRLLYPG